MQHEEDLDYGALLGLELTLWQLADSGLMFGKVDLIRLHCEDKVREWKVKDVEESSKIATAKEWAPYGWSPGDLLQ